MSVLQPPRARPTPDLPPHLLATERRISVPAGVLVEVERKGVLTGSGRVVVCFWTARETARLPSQERSGSESSCRSARGKAEGELLGSPSPRGGLKAKSRALYEARGCQPSLL